MGQNVNLLPRDILLRDTFTPAENLLFTTILITANLTFWLADPRSYWLLGLFLIAGGMTVVILKTHEATHPFFVNFLWPKFWLCTAPLWILLMQYLVGIFQDPVSTVRVGKEEFMHLEPVTSWLPISTGSQSTWTTMLGYCAVYLVTINLFIVPKSRAFFERLLPWLCLSSVLVAIFGYIQEGLTLSAPLFTDGTGQLDFFSCYPYDGHWAAFAIIWTCINISMSLLVSRYNDSPPFIESTGPWYLSGGILLGSTAYLVEARWPAALLMLTLSAMLMLVSMNFLIKIKDPNSRPISILTGLASSAMFASALITIFQKPVHPMDRESLRQAALDLFKESPLFGWGIDSFEILLPLYGSDLLVGQNYERAEHDLFQFLSEVGLIGVAFPITLILILIFRYVRGRHDIQLTNHLLIGCAVIVGLSFGDTPFMSPTVCFSFFTSLFIALRWADITRNRADEVDAPRPTLVTPASKRRVPFHNKASEYRFK
ncbi:MAG: O-antigen ligase family protein [Verrucomicrobiota bacterium]